jgi:hypothetical protein
MSGNKPTHSARRRFLKGVAGVGGATVLVALGREYAAQDSENPTTSTSKSETHDPAGYHLTPHIKSYYETARL